MKTITARFTFSDGSQATATGQFEVLNGRGPVAWGGNAQPILDGIPKGYTRQLPVEMDGEAFARAMQGNGERCGALVEITEEGEWLVFTKDLPCGPE